MLLSQGHSSGPASKTPAGAGPITGRAATGANDIRLEILQHRLAQRANSVLNNPITVSSQAAGR